MWGVNKWSAAKTTYLRTYNDFSAPRSLSDTNTLISNSFVSETTNCFEMHITRFKSWQNVFEKRSLSSLSQRESIAPEFPIVIYDINNTIMQ